MKRLLLVVTLPWKKNKHIAGTCMSIASEPSQWRQGMEISKGVRVANMLVS